MLLVSYQTINGYWLIDWLLYRAPQQPCANRGAFVSISSKKREVLRSDKEVERLYDKKEALADDGRRLQREGPATEKDLDLALVVNINDLESTFKRSLLAKTLG